MDSTSLGRQLGASLQQPPTKEHYRWNLRVETKDERRPDPFGSVAHRRGATRVQMDLEF